VKELKEEEDKKKKKKLKKRKIFTETQHSFY